MKLLQIVGTHIQTSTGAKLSKRFPRVKLHEFRQIYRQAQLEENTDCLAWETPQNE